MGDPTTKKGAPATLTSVTARVRGIRLALGERHASFKLPREGLWVVDGVLGPRSLPPRALDLIDLAGAIYRVESQVPARPTNPVAEWAVSAPVRDLRFWNESGGVLLARVLTFLTRAKWTFDFRARPRAPTMIPASSVARRVDQIALFSGGMDSACGAGVHAGAKSLTQLVGFATRQKTLQQELAHELGYQPPTQWRLPGARGKEGMNLIRSMMFLSLGAAVAETFGATHIYQYENGALASAIPPAGNFLATRHAHPILHHRLEQLFAAVFERPLVIVNPFALMTKREVANAFANAAGTNLSESVLRRTETCWQLYQAHAGGEPKTPGVPCGVCTPCIVRRTARPREVKARAWPGWRGYAFDLMKPQTRNSPKLGRAFRAYLELVEIVSLARDDLELLRELAPEARVVVGGPDLPLGDAANLLRRFVSEFCDTFQIVVPKRTQ